MDKVMIHPSADGMLPKELLVPEDWVIDGFLEEGLSTFSGSMGVGKTSSLLPLLFCITGLVCIDGIDIKLRRKLIWYAEHPNQVYRILYGIAFQYAGGGAFKAPDPQKMAEMQGLIQEWVLVIQAKRRSPLEQAHTEHWQKIYRRAQQDGGNWVPNDVPNGKILVAPLTVLDTASANIQLQSENDGSEVADALFAIREGTTDPESRTQLPVALIGHVAKAFKLADCRDAEKMNTIGSQAWDANVHSNYFMVKEGETRFIVSGKRRDAGGIREIRCTGRAHAENRYNRYGFEQSVGFISVSYEMSSAQDRAEQVEQQKSSDNGRAIEIARRAVLNYISESEEGRRALSSDAILWMGKAALADHLVNGASGFNRDQARTAIDELSKSDIESRNMPQAVKAAIKAKTGEATKGTRKYYDLKKSTLGADIQATVDGEDDAINHTVRNHAKPCETVPPQGYKG